MLDLSIIIVNWNGKEMLNICLRSIYRFVKNINYEIIIVDNNSTDGSQHLIKEKFPLVKLIKNDKNLGFAGGVNRGLKISKGRYILLLNNDTELINNAFLPMIKFMDSNSKVGIVGCRLKNRAGEIEESCDNFPTFESRVIGKICEHFSILRKRGISMRHWRYNRIKEVDIVSGACLLTKQNLMNKIGGLDERFFMYHEDTEYCYQVKKRYLKIFFLPFSTIIHAHGKSKNWDPGEKEILYRRTQYLFVKKHFGFFQRFLYKFYFIKLSIFSEFYHRLKNNLKEAQKYQGIRRIYIRQ